MSAFWNRLRFFQACIGAGLNAVIISWSTLGVVALAQQEFLPHPYCDYRIFDLRWYEWTIAFLILLVVSIGEALYQYAQLPTKPVLYDHRGIEFLQGHIKRGRASRILLPILAAVVLLILLIQRRLESPSSPTQLQLPQSSATTISAATPLPTIALSPAIFMECHIVSLPIVVPIGGIHLVGINERYMRGEHSGLYDIPNDGDKEIRWPDDKTMRDKLKPLLPKFWDQTGTIGYRCEVSNHGPENVLYLAVPLDFWFSDQKTPIRYYPLIPALDAGKTFSFYVLNDCPDDVAAIWQQTARAQTSEQPSMHDVKLWRDYSYSAEQLMSFFPSRAQWVGQQPCQ